MKKYITLGLLSFTLILGSCKKFLEESNQNLLRPTTASDLAQTLLGEGFPLTDRFHTYMDVITDDVEANFLNDPFQIAALSRWAPAFLWKNTMFEDMPVSGIPGTDSYTTYYSRIKGCNVVLDYLGKVSGSEAEKAKIKGEALFLRGFYYFNLVNLYGKAYGANGSNPDSDLGVPLVLSSDVTRDLIKRATVTQVYAQVEKDLLEANTLLSSTSGSNIYHPGVAATCLLLSRVYLYSRQWDKSIDYATKALAIKSTLKNLNEVTANPASGFDEASPPYQMANALVSPEVYWGYGFDKDYADAALGAGVSGIIFEKAAFTVSASLSDAYEVDDRRNVLYFNYGGQYNPNTGVLIWSKFYGFKYGSLTSIIQNSKAFRVSEAYLNRAEANIQKALAGNGQGINGALADLNLLRSKRITTSKFQNINITDPTALFEFYKAERRRELCFEDQRWFDLRRWNLSVSHSIQLSATATDSKTILPGDPEFTLPIPQTALRANPELVQNP
ncbi:RagB/SusD family nutrient uptake outer membrane protein [Pedobacter hiemivivus]|uniref:RagB/SusD family nutrient uptake outer membrane protein n=1 Tax=Pedobacter hiemivivus TaxID=2530454 RepID=A0A4U1GHR6_9SPHI|nr:RagB/SusD family nutrient uptake outer membrane protein [Pedobacter hiemivivus]TKC63795.1 RagB/SusD family nutrient uptake outer membrane protein [Pedobacter hiemivivus]